jgi:hypothetical protein
MQEQGRLHSGESARVTNPWSAFEAHEEPQTAAIFSLQLYQSNDYGLCSVTSH